LRERKKRITEAGTRPKNLGCCRVESLVSIDDRGQMVLPKEIREKAGIRAGDKLAVVTWEKGGQVCCLSLVKSDDFGKLVRDMLGPMIKEISQK
jgi:antitoxin PrlF